MLFDKLGKLSEDVALVVLGGDIFDKVPNMEEIELYFYLVSQMRSKTIIFDGNHEATRKGKTFLKNLAEATEYNNKLVEVIDGIYQVQNMDFIPYTELKKFDPKDFTGNILFTHVRGEIPPHVKPEIDLSLFDRWDTVYAGDLHAHSNSQRNIVYPGSPLSTSFHRSPITNGVLLIESDDNTWEWLDLKLPQLIRKTIDNADDAVPTEYDHTIYEFVGNMSDIHSVDINSDIIDKKIITKQSDTSIAIQGMSIPEELSLYLIEVLDLKKELDDIIGTFNDYTKSIEME